MVGHLFFRQRISDRNRDGLQNLILKMKIINVFVKETIIILAAGICVAGLFYLMASKSIKRSDEESRRRELFYNKIGTKLPLGKDTLIIIDGSYLMGSYTLSNGVKISSRIVQSK